MIELLILFLAIPVGFLIAWLARDELIMGRKWFVALIVLSILDLLFSILMELNYLAMTVLFVMVVTGISYWKSYDRKWTKTTR